MGAELGNPPGFLLIGINLYLVGSKAESETQKKTDHILGRIIKEKKSEKIIYIKKKYFENIANLLHT